MAYNAELDQIMISVRTFSEFWIIDHGTTTARGRRPQGRKRGKGGDPPHRWGNPEPTGRHDRQTSELFNQHDATGSRRDYPGAGTFLVFNNGGGRPAGNYLSVDKLVAPRRARGPLHPRAGPAFGPSEAIWSSSRRRRRSFCSSFIMSGATGYRTATR